MVKPEVIRKRLHKLDEYVSILKKFHKYSFKEFISDPEHYGSAERFLQLAIETLTDLGNHVVADLNLGEVNWYSDIPSILNKKGYLDSLLAEKWVRMIGFRNTLVHDYLDIDRTIVYDVLKNGLSDIEAIKRIFVEFL